MNLLRLAHLDKLVVLALLTLFACQAEPRETAESADTSQTVSPDTSMASAAPAQAKININTGTEEQFITIPGVGDRMVHEFEEYRPYVSIQQFRREIGKYVDEQQVAAYEQYIYVPVDPNESDAETLQQIPGLDATEAEQLVAGRPYASDQAFLDALATYVSAEERSQAQAYLAAQ